jgi:hypothetical protein
MGGQPGVEPHLLHGHGAAKAHAHPVDLLVQIDGGLLLCGKTADGEAPLLQVLSQLGPIGHHKTLLLIKYRSSDTF